MPKKPKLNDLIQSYLGLSNLESVRLANFWNRYNRVDHTGHKSVRLEHSDESAVLWLHGQIGADIWSDSIDASAMIQQIDSLRSDKLTIRVHSPGGDAFDGIALAGAVSRFGGKSVAIIDGLAASAAAVVTAAADEVIVGPQSSFMIHRAHGLLVGNADDAREFSGLLDRLDGQIAGMLAKKSGQPQKDVLMLMSEEFWAFADEIVESGFADVFDDGREEAKNLARFDLKSFGHVPDLAEQTYGAGTESPIMYPERAAAARLALMDVN